MAYAVIDLEFNQPFNFPRGHKTILVPECPFEIIQIGVVKMNEAFEITDTHSFLAKPSVYKRIHPFVRKITGLGTEALAQQPVFPQAYEEFLAFLGPEPYVFCVWGGGDIKTLFDNVKYFELENKLSDQYIDVQQLATKKLAAGPGNSVGLKNAALQFNLEIVEDFHDALNDARYTAKLFQMLHTDDMTVHTYTPGEKKAPKGLDFSRLYKAMEKDFGHKLSKKERRIVRKAYLMGRDRQFDRSVAAAPEADGEAQDAAL